MALTTGALDLRREAFTVHVPALHVADGAGLAVVGPNGSGKSTLLLALRGLLAVEGRIERDDPAASVFATPALLRGTVARNVAVANPAATRDVAALLTTVGLVGFAERDARGLSSGERQRVALARALACAPRTLFLDEALANVDAPGRVALRRAIGAYARAARCGLVVATQSYGDVEAFAASALVLGDGPPRLVDRGSAAWDDDTYLALLRAEAGAATTRFS